MQTGLQVALGRMTHTPCPQSHPRPLLASPTSDKPNIDHCTSRRKGVAKQTPFSSLGLIPIYWSNVRCRGDEDNILLCGKDLWRGGPCPQKMAAAVACSLSHGKSVFSFYLHCFPVIPADTSVFVKSLPKGFKSRRSLNHHILQSN